VQAATRQQYEQFYSGLPGFTQDDYWLESRWHREKSDEDLVARINNDLQNLWRSGTSSGLGPAHPAMRFVDRMLQEWVSFYDSFRDAGFSRAFDPFDLWTDYHTELMGWAARMEDLVKRLPTLVPNVTQQQEVEAQLEARGVQRRAQEYADIARDDSVSPQAQRLLLGFFVVGAVLVTGVWIAAGRRR